MPHSPASLNLLQRIDDTEKKLNDDLSIKVRKLRDKAINREIEKAKGYQMPVTPVISVPQYLAQRTYSLAPRLLCEYKQIEKSNITELIPLYFEKEIIKDDNKKIILSFDTIRIFGEIENPMYSLKDIGIKNSTVPSTDIYLFCTHQGAWMFGPAKVKESIGYACCMHLTLQYDKEKCLPVLYVSAEG